MTDRPNILWIVSEDCPPRFGCYGDPMAQTPNLDALAADGVVFEQAFSPAPVCAPSRFSLLTGVPSESNPPANQMRAVARADGLPTYPALLRAAGYYCTNNDKTDYNCDIDPAAIWDDSSTEGHWRHRPDGAPFVAVFNFFPTHESSVFGHDLPFVVDPAAVRVPAYLPDTPEIRTDLAQHYGRIARMDAFAGMLIDQLRADGLYEDTVIIQTSDHGGVHPRSKRFCYDEGLHVPLIMRVPGRFALPFPAPGQRIEAPVSTLAVAPTLLTIAGLTPPATMSAEPLLRAKFDAETSLAFGIRDRMDERIDMIRTVRDRRYRYIRNYHPHLPWGLHQGYAWQAAGYRSWEAEHLAGRLDPVQDAFWHAKPTAELYDTRTDPDEVVNLAGRPEYAETEARLREAVRAHLIEVGDGGFAPEDAGPTDPHGGSGAAPLAELVEFADRAIERDPAFIPELTTRLGAADPALRRWAALGLLMLAAELGDGNLATAAAPALRAALGIETVRSVTVALAEALARITGEPAAYRALAEQLDPGCPFPVRLAALNALRGLDPERVATLRQQIEAAADGHEYVRRAAADVMTMLDRGRSVTA